MTPQEREAAAWREASRNLGIEFISPFSLNNGSETLSYVGLVPCFGSKRGTAVIIEEDLEKQSRLCHVAAAQGYGYSCFGPDGSDYDRDVFIEVLNDWEWVVPARPPAWYSGSPPEGDEEL
jgi:hypothetical protein